eukprot:154293-Chlamydomonas_euryale.AAC.1
MREVVWQRRKIQRMDVLTVGGAGACALDVHVNVRSHVVLLPVHVRSTHGHTIWMYMPRAVTQSHNEHLHAPRSHTLSHNEHLHATRCHTMNIYMLHAVTQ